MQFFEQSGRLRDFVIRLEQQHRVDAVLRKQGIVLTALNRPDILEMLSLGTIIDVGDGCGIDINRVHKPRRSDAFSRTDSEPARSRPNVSNCASGLETEDVHYSIDLELLVAVRIFKDRQIACIGLAGSTLSTAGCGLCLNCKRAAGEQEGD